MPPITADLLVTALAVAIGILAFLHLLAGARASVVLAHQIEYDRRHKPPADHPDESGAHGTPHDHTEDDHATEAAAAPHHRPTQTAPVEVG